MPLPNTSWLTLPAHPVLSDAEVHIWRASLTQPEDYAALLSSDEQARARRFHFEKDRRRFIAARGTLRSILGRYLNSTPEKLRFEYRAYGKPALTAEPLCFNLAHSEELALYAVTLNRAVGIDLEYIRPIPDAEKLAEQFFSPAEKDELNALPPDKKLRAFFCGWTRKEAYLKARGEGITHPLNRFSVSMDCDQPAKLLEIEGNPQAASKWSLQTLIPAREYIGALAMEGNIQRFLLYTYNIEER